MNCVLCFCYPVDVGERHLGRRGEGPLVAFKGSDTCGKESSGNVQEAPVVQGELKLRGADVMEQKQIKACIDVNLGARGGLEKLS